MFNKENSTGYSDSEICDLNEALKMKLEGVENQDRIDFITKEFRSLISRNYSKV